MAYLGKLGYHTLQAANPFCSFRNGPIKINEILGNWNAPNHNVTHCFHFVANHSKEDRERRKIEIRKYCALSELLTLYTK